jgi:hypothetical protein
MAFPLTLDEYLLAIAKETARMSWPGQMAPILKAGAKKSVEAYFTSDFLGHLRKIWRGQRVVHYDRWHDQRVQELARSLDEKVKSRNRKGARTGYLPEAVAAKLLNTFMHQLMKYKECRFLWADLHLVLDTGVFKALGRLAVNSRALQSERTDSVLTQNPYTIPYREYKLVQRRLRKFVGELNRRPGNEFRLTSRIELNLLWTNGH